MKGDFRGWNEVASHLAMLAATDSHGDWKLNHGQRNSLKALAKLLSHNGVLIADEVGMGKTRIAVAVARSVVAAGGRVAILVPPGLGFQWRDELRQGGVECPPVLRSLWQYLAAWEAEERQSRSPWFREPVVLLSHAFTNWRLGERSDSWRWALLPELYGQLRKKFRGSFPRSFHDEKIREEILDDQWVLNAAESIADALSGDPSSPGMDMVGNLMEKVRWPAALDPSEYGRDGDFRCWLETAVGLGLGFFDLVIIDEAHKSRQQESMLSRLLEGVVLTTATASRRLGMTATPVELDVRQWQETLKRIGLPGTELQPVIEGYASAVQDVRRAPSDQLTRQAFKEAALSFQRGLSPYLLRRDKRQDTYVQKFAHHTQRPFHEYREQSEIVIETGELPPKWLHCVCAAEALSVVSRLADDPVAKRLRLTLGNGHGLATLLDHVKEEEFAAKGGEAGESVAQGKAQPSATAEKRQSRAHWWRNIVSRTFQGEDHPHAALYEHPAILAAVEAIEETCHVGEKVLVFGRFTLPLEALVQLLNAREMLRSLDQGRPWPQEKVSEDEWPAVLAAHSQLGRNGAPERALIDQALARQYQRLQDLRKSYRSKLLDNLERGFQEGSNTGRSFELYCAFRSALEVSESDDGGTLALVAKAMMEVTGADATGLCPADFADAFVHLLDAASDRDEGDTNGDGNLDEDEAADLWETLEQRLGEEYGRQQGGFARLMNGQTKPETRRLLQAAFNRRASFPKALVTQSMVGREGLNLHKACRTVVLLHPEWNPGVVEQQIGRVDRVGSLWETLLDEALAEASGSTLESLPRIQIRPVIFKGTYDEKNWQVLRDRWDDLRAQLHGVVISPMIAEKYPNSSFIQEINAAAPDFSPT